jgi:hypothetical protein
MFQQPREGDRVDLGDLIGSLVLIWAKEVREGIPTSFGPKDAIGADIHVLDGPKGGEKFEDTLLFGLALIGALKGAVGGDPVLGRVGQGTSKPGQKPPWILLPFNDQDAAIATGYIQRMKPGFQPPETAPAAAAAAPVALDINGLDPAVVELLRKTGAIPAA